MDDEVRVTVTLPRAIVEKIHKLADANDTTLRNTVIESVELNEAISASERSGAKIIIQKPSGGATLLSRVRVDGP